MNKLKKNIIMRNSIIKSIYDSVIIIYPTNGLCNKLRVTFSYYQYAKSQNKKLIVIWPITIECAGFFLDYFEPIKNIQFEKTNKYALSNIKYLGNSWHPEYDPSKVFIYSELKPLPSIMNVINNYIKLLESNYIAVHIRRTDHINLATKNNLYTTDEEFIKFIEDNNRNLYIATDNKDTYDNFYYKYKNRIKILLYEQDNNKLRKTSLEESIIDLYMCVYSNNFKGSGYSSFSDLIIQLKSKI